jgi:hypothetical protein
LIAGSNGATVAFSVTNADDSRMYRLEIIAPTTYRWTKYEGSYIYSNLGSSTAYGKMRIVRSGTDITLYYKNLDAGSWTNAYTFSSASTDDMYITLYIYQGVTTIDPEYVKFDNFIVNSAGGFTMDGGINEIYHSAAIDTLYPGSAYSLGGMLYISRGGGRFNCDLLSSDLSSTFLNFPIDVLDKPEWIDVSKIFSVAVQITNPILRISHVSTYGFTTAYFDDFGVSDYKNFYSIGVLQIYPEWSMRRQAIQNRADHRTKGGKMYSYTWGDYEQFNVPLEYVQNSKAAIINSWWSEDTLIHFKIYSGGVWQTNCCHLMNDTAPFDERVKPYDQYRSGVLELETF